MYGVGSTQRDTWKLKISIEKEHIRELRGEAMQKVMGVDGVR